MTLRLRFPKFLFRAKELFGDEVRAPLPATVHTYTPIHTVRIAGLSSVPTHCSGMVYAITPQYNNRAKPSWRSCSSTGA